MPRVGKQGPKARPDAESLLQDFRLSNIPAMNCLRGTERDEEQKGRIAKSLRPQPMYLEGKADECTR